MRDLLVLIGILGWIGAIFIRLLPQRRKLLNEFGHDKDVAFFRKIAKSGHEPSRRLIRETWLFIWAAVLGAFVMALTK